MLLPLRTTVLVTVCAFLCTLLAVRQVLHNTPWRLSDPGGSLLVEQTANKNRDSQQDTALKTASEKRTTNDQHATCSLGYFRDVTANFQERLPRRAATQHCVESDFLDVVRMRSGQSPKLLSRRARSRRRWRHDRRYVVPNVVHYIHLGRGMTFTFISYLSFLSARKFIKPDYIFLHGDTLPTGSWWERTLLDVPNIYHVHVRGILGIRGKRFRFPTQHSNLLRLFIMLGK